MKRRKIMSLLLTASLGAGMVTGTAFAADSYKEVEREALARSIEQFTEQYQEGLDELTGETAEHADISLKLSDSGKALLGLFAPVDVSWLDSVTLSDSVSVGDNKMTQMMDLLVNGTRVCTLEYYMDMETMDICMRIPELSESYLKMNYNELMEMEADAMEVNADPDQAASTELAEMSQSMMLNYFEKLPTAEVVSTLLNRYGELAIDGFEDQGADGEEQLTAGGVSQTANALDGVMDSQAAADLANTVLDTLKEDQELKPLIEDWTQGSEEYSYESFLSAIDEIQEELNTESDSDDAAESNITSRIWVDENDEIIGRKITIETQQDNAEILVLETADGDQRGFTAQITSDGESYGIDGSGTITDGLLDGQYFFTANGESLASIDVFDYDPAALEQGYLNGTYELDLGQFATEEGMEFLTNFKVSASCSGDQENSLFALDVLSSGQSLVTLEIAGSPSEFTAYPDTDSFETVYDLNNEDDMNAYLSEINPDLIFANLENAGMPAEFITDVINLMSGEESGGYEDYDYSGYDYDEYAETETEVTLS